MASALSQISLDDVLERWHDDLDGDLLDLDAEAVAAAQAGGRLVPVDVEEAAVGPVAGADGSHKPPSTTKLPPPPPPTSVFVKAREASTSQEGEGPMVRAFEEYVEQASLPHGLSASALVAEARQLQAVGRILGAHAALAQLCTQSGLALRDLHPHSDELGIDVAAVEADVAHVHAALAGVDDDEGYMVSRDDALRVLYRHEKGGTCHSIKMRVTFDHPVAHILAIAHEWDLIPTWNRFVLEAVKLAEPSILESYVYGAQWMMPPFKDMQATIHARGYDLADSHRCLLITMRDVGAEELPVGAAPVPLKSAKRKAVNFLPGSCIVLRPLPGAVNEVTGAVAPRVESRLVVHLDPHIPYVPASLVNFALGILAPYIFSQMAKILDSAFADPLGEYSRRIAAQPELYGLIDARMAEFAEELAATGEAAGHGGGDPPPVVSNPTTIP